MKIGVVLGTRPEAIKLAPVILAFRNQADVVCKVCISAQHREMLDQALNLFGISADMDLNLMAPNQSLAELTGRCVQGLDLWIQQEQPDLVLIQGDTTTAFCAALSGFYQRIPVAHLEAGLRTGDMNRPWPEEANRILISRLSSLHFAPTQSARHNLLRENVADADILVSGNTVIDALFLAIKKIESNPPRIHELPDFLQIGKTGNGQQPRMVLITGHRRESFGKGFENICQAIADLAQRFSEVHFVYPVHLNPNVREPVARILGGNYCVGNIHLIDPIPYLEFVAMLKRATLILTDSGGVQEEAPSLGKPVLVMRDVTERPEAVEAGTVRLVGSDHHNIVQEVSTLLTDNVAYEKMARTHNPYGDGRSSPRVVMRCIEFLSRKRAKTDACSNFENRSSSLK